MKKQSDKKRKKTLWYDFFLTEENEKYIYTIIIIYRYQNDVQIVKCYLLPSQVFVVESVKAHIC